MKAIKHDQEKPKLSMVPPELVESVAQVMMYGADKYGRDNWRQGMEHSRYLDAAYRHLHALIKGEEFDPESGLPHLAHTACNLAFLLYYKEHSIGIDDLNLTPKQK